MSLSRLQCLAAAAAGIFAQHVVHNLKRQLLSQGRVAAVTYQTSSERLLSYNSTNYYSVVTYVQCGIAGIELGHDVRTLPVKPQLCRTYSCTGDTHTYAARCARVSLLRCQCDLLTSMGHAMAALCEVTNGTLNSLRFIPSRPQLKVTFHTASALQLQRYQEKSCGAGCTATEITKSAILQTPRSADLWSQRFEGSAVIPFATAGF